MLIPVSKYQLVPHRKSAFPPGKACDQGAALPNWNLIKIQYLCVMFTDSAMGIYCSRIAKEMVLLSFSVVTGSCMYALPRATKCSF